MRANAGGGAGSSSSSSKKNDTKMPVMLKGNKKTSNAVEKSKSLNIIKNQKSVVKKKAGKGSK